MVDLFNKIKKPCQNGLIFPYGVSNPAQHGSRNL